MAKRVFISYAQSPPENKRLVAELVTALRVSGLAVTSDQDVVTPQGPPEGWPKWMLDGIENADWVIVVCNEAYYRRFRGKEEPGRGLGARWEGAIIGQAIYGEGTFNRKFIPVLPGDDSVDYIPEPLRGFTYYRLPSDLPKLTAALAEKPASGSAPVSWPTKAAEQSHQSGPIEPKSSRKPVTGTPAASRRKPAATWSKIAPYAGLAFGAFACGLLVLSLMLWKADTLARLGLTGRAYYIALLPLSLSVAAFLFGALRSYAVYSGKQFGGALELGGPIVGFALTVIGGFVLVPDQTTFPLTVFVHGEPGVDQIVLRNSGHVIVDLGPDRRREAIGDKGQAYFPAIPAGLRGQDVPVSIDAEGYELVKPGQKLRLEGSVLYLLVRPKAGRITGRVQDEDGKPLAGVAISIGDLSVNSDKTGQFEVRIPGDRMKPEFFLQAIATNFAPYRTIVVPGGNEVGVILRRQP